MTQPATIDQLMQEFQKRLPHLSHAENEVVRAFLVRSRTEVTIWKVESKVQSEESNNHFKAA